MNAPIMNPADRFPFLPYENRPKLEWPNGARVALWVLPNIEHYEYRPEFENMRKSWPRMPAPDVLGYGVRDYGNRMGVWRMFDVFDKHQVTCTVSLNFGIIEHYPDIWEAMEALLVDRPNVVDLVRYRVGPSVGAFTGPGAAGGFWYGI